MFSLVLSILLLVDRALVPSFALIYAGGNPNPPDLPVEIQLISPPPGAFYIQDLWRIHLNNTSTELFDVYIYTTVERNGFGLVMEATTASFLLPPGLLSLGTVDLSPISTVFYDDNVQTSLEFLGSFPDGVYTFSIYVMEVGGGIIGQGGYTQESQNFSSPSLQYPMNSDEIVDPLPIFTWYPVIPSGYVEYKFKIVEVLSGQSPEQAIHSNPSWFVSENISSEEFVYPISAKAFEVGSNYAWQVQSFYEGSQVGESEVWMFSYTGTEVSSDAGTGIWCFETGGRVSCSPAIAPDGSIIIGGIDGFVYSINPSGKELWRCSAGGPVYSLALNSAGTIFASGDFGMCSIDPSGFLLWRNNETGPLVAGSLILSNGRLYVGSIEGVFYSIDSNTGVILDSFETDDSIVLPAVCDENGNLYFASDNHKLYSLTDDSCLTENWSFKVDDEFVGGPVLYNNQIFAAAGKEVFCFSLHGEQIWKAVVPSQVYSGPVITAGGTLYVGSGSGNIYTIETLTGHNTGVIPAGAVVTSTPAFTVTGSLYVGCDDGFLYCFAPSGFLEWEFETDATISSSPVIGIDGTVYFGSDDFCVYAVSGAGSGAMVEGWPQYGLNSSKNGSFLERVGQE